MNDLIRNTRYYRWITLDNNDSMLEEIILLKVNNENSCSVKVKRGNDVGSIKKITLDYLKTNYTKLSPDGYIIFNIVSVRDNLKDVMVTIVRKKDIDNHETLPYAVCRQCLVDIFAKQLDKTGKDYVGLSVSKDSCPADVSFDNFFACDNICYTEYVSFYIGDSLDYIFQYIKNVDRFDNTLVNLFNDHCNYKSGNNKFIADVFKKDSCLDGYCKSLKDLLILNNFKYDLNTAYGIYPLNISDDDLAYGVLNDNARTILSEILNTRIEKSIVLKYDRDIDLSQIQRKYCLISTNSDTVYVVGYVTSGQYYNLKDMEDEDNINKLQQRFPSVLIQEAYSSISFNKKKYEI